MSNKEKKAENYKNENSKKTVFLNIIGSLKSSDFKKSDSIINFFSQNAKKLDMHMAIKSTDEFCLYLFKDALKLEKLIKKENDTKMKLELKKIEKAEYDKKSFIESIQNEKDIEKIVDNFYSSKVKKYFPEIKFEDYLKILGKKTVSNINKINKRNEYITIKNQYANKQGLVHTVTVPSLLNISEKEYVRWRNKGLITIHSYSEFKKWGQNLKTPNFDYDYLLTITPKMIEKWRDEDSGLSSKTSINEWNLLISNLKEQFNISTIDHKFYYHPKLFESQKFIINIQIKTKVTTKNFEEIKDCIKIIHNDSLKLLNKIEEVEKFNAFCEDNEISENELIHFNNNFNNRAVFQKDLREDLELVFNKIISARSQEYISDILNIKNYHESFINARNINREISFIVGETNSGKTHEALQSLIQAESGVYLAPLRLLAFEIYEKLNNLGIPCNLITGEEEIIIADAKHTASTIECVNLNKRVEVAIIDEFQMINDTQRGWAWTQAFLGVPANKVFVIGNSSSLKKCVSLLSNTKDNYTITIKERLSNLQVLKSTVSLTDLRKGDALIAFSRQAVLEYAFDLKDMGKSVAIIYGNLSPEVRRRQAEKFNSGKADILITTDAIGMGLNLPIDRVIFSSLVKFDGLSRRNLNNSEIKQIAGRAGRYQNEGQVCMLNEYDHNETNTKEINMIRSALNSHMPDDHKLFDVCPNNWHLNKMSDILKTKNIKSILIYFAKLNKTEFYKNLLLENAIWLYEELHKNKKFMKLPLDVQLKLLLSPVDLKNITLINYYKFLIKSITENINQPFEASDVYNNNFENSLLTAEICVKAISMYNYLSKFSDNLNRETTKNASKMFESYILKELELKHFQKKQRYADYFFDF